MDTQNIQVLVRVRPLNSRELQMGASSCLQVQDSQTIILDTKPEQKRFLYDSVQGEDKSQEDVFMAVGQPMSRICLEGLNCSVFAYGQTGAGKTFTMMGDDTNKGLQPRVIEELFSLIEHNDKSEVSVKCSFLEIYNEQILDLLNPNRNLPLQIREDVKKGVYVENLIEESTKSYQQSLQILKSGALNRHIGNTQMNSESSRSHSIFILNIESKTHKDGMIQIKRSRLNFVDLAGSERQKQTASQGERLREAGQINKSLTTLGVVINSLVENSVNPNNKRHVPYRDSKLTFILRECLGGNSKTFMIANVSPSTSQFQETLSTLKFAQRAKLIQNQISVNEDVAGTVEGLKAEIIRLKSQLKNVPYTNMDETFNQFIEDIMNRINNLKLPGIEQQGDIMIDQIEQFKLKMFQNIGDLRFNQSSDIQRLEEEIMIRKRQNNSLKADLQILKNQKEELVSKLKVYEKQLKHHKQELQSLQSQPKISMEEESCILLAQKQEDIENFKMQIKLKDQQISQLQSELDKWMEDHTILKESSEKDKDILNEQLQQLQEDIDTANMTLEFQRDELQKRQVQIENKDNLIGEISSQFDRLKGDIESLQRTYMSQKDQIDEKNSAISQLKQQRVQTAKLLDKQKKVKKQLKQDNKTLKTNLDAKTLLILLLTSEKKLMVDQVSQLQADIDEKEAHLAELQCSLIKTNQSMKEMTRQMEDLQNQLNQKEEENNQKTFQIQQMKKNEAIIKERSLQLLQQSEDLKRQCNQVKEEIQKARECQDALSKYETLVEESNKQKQQMKKFLETYDLISNRLSQKEGECELLRQEMDQKDQINERLSRELDECRSKVIIQKKQIGDLKESLNLFQLESRAQDPKLRTDSKSVRMQDFGDSVRKKIRFG